MLCQPPGMGRREANKSTVDAKTQCINWHVEWVFPDAAGLVTHCKVGEDVPLLEALERHLRGGGAVGALTPAPPGAPPPPPGAAGGSKGRLQAPVKHELRRVMEGCASTRFFMEKVGVPPSTAARWLELPPTQSLRTSLAGKWLFEFPTLHVALPGREGEYPLASSAAPEAPPEANVWL